MILNEEGTPFTVVGKSQKRKIFNPEKANALQK